nr:hypothetical protein [uncultured Draconibacterium sp.]
MKSILLTVIAVASIFSIATAQTSRYVDPNATSNGNGSSWANAFNNLQDVINASGSSSFDNICIAEGALYLGSTITHNVRIYGGYKIGTKTQTGFTVLDGQNTRRVISITGGLSSDTRLGRLIIQNGKQYNAGGIYVENSTPIFRNLIFHNNTASGANGKGGGLYVKQSSLELTNILYTENTSNSNGGAIYIENSYPVITNVTLTNNYENEKFNKIHLNRL